MGVYSNYSVTLNANSALGENISILLSVGEHYTVQEGVVDFCFKVSSVTSKNEVAVTWVKLDLNPLTSPSSLPLSITDIKRGFTSSNISPFKLNYFRRGYLDIDNIVFELFFKTINKWTWNSSDFQGQQIEDSTKFVDFFFFNKRPTTRQPYGERTLGATDNVDSSWQNSTHRSNPTSMKTTPYMVFQPLSVTPTDEELLRVEEFYRYISSVPASHTPTYDNVEVYEPPRLFEFSYQVTAVTDNWKDCRILQSHLLNSVIPRDRGERYISFPSGFTHTVVIEESDISAVEDTGQFETTITFIFKLPLVEKYPELTFSWITGLLYVNSPTPVTVVV